MLFVKQMEAEKMAFDAFVLSAVAGEIEEKIIKTGARLNRIYQLNPTDLLLYFKGEQEVQPLFISIHTQRGRIHFTNRHYSHPPSPPPFCMLSRKHLGNGVLVSVEQPPLERYLYLNFLALNESGKKVDKTLVVEIMGRRSNVILLDRPGEKKERVILGVLKPVPPSINRVRTLLPHYTYSPPPVQEKLHPYALDYEHFQQEMNRLEGQPAPKALLENFRGFSPFLAEEIAARAKTPIISPGAACILWQKLQEILQIYEEKKWEPTLLYDKEKKPLDCSVVKPRQATGNHCRSFNSISSILDELYEYKEKEEERQNLFAMLTRNVEQAVKKTRKKETVQLLELEAAGKADYYRQCGELILMNLKDIPARSREVELENIFSEQGGMIKISLDPRLSPPLNAQRYFRKYRKARQGEKKISGNLEQTRREISYLESVLFSLQKADLQTLREIKEELEETGYLPVPQKSRYPKQTAVFNPLKFISSRGEEIFVGRNNRQNEYLVQRFAAGTELWFHVKDLPGAHVIVRPGVPHEKTIHEAALLAAYFSRGAHSSKVPVDYTQVKNVRRLPGGKPGMVTYTNYKTLYVTPDEQNLRPLLAQHKA